jgi:hypothetical protein
VDKRLIRLLYIFEFLVALIAVFTLWSPVGGQGHLDMMAWWWKLGLGAGTAFAVVKLTAAAVESEDPWHTRSVRWFLLMLALLGGCAAVTYYYHVNEPPEEDQEEDTEPTITGVLMPRLSVTTQTRFFSSWNQRPAVMCRFGANGGLYHVLGAPRHPGMARAVPLFDTPCNTKRTQSRRLRLGARQRQVVRHHTAVYHFGIDGGQVGVPKHP